MTFDQWWDSTGQNLVDLEANGERLPLMTKYGIAKQAWQKCQKLYTDTESDLLYLIHELSEALKETRKLDYNEPHNVKVARNALLERVAKLEER